MTVAMLASAGDDIRVWTGDTFDDVVTHYQSGSQKVSALAWDGTSASFLLFVAFLIYDTVPIYSMVSKTPAPCADIG